MGETKNKTMEDKTTKRAIDVGPIDGGKVNPPAEKQVSEDGIKISKADFEAKNNAVQKLYRENELLRARVQELSLSGFFKRIEFLLKVLEFPHLISEEFIARVANELEDLLFSDEDISKDTETPQQPDAPTV